MTYFLSKSRTLLLWLLMPILVSLACLTLTNEDSQADVVFGPGPFTITDMKTGLAGLASYKATLTYSFDGSRAGNSERWSKTYIMLMTQDPAARHLTIETAGNISDIEAVFMAELDGAAYERLGENTCTASVIEQGNSTTDWLEPAGILTSIIGAEEAEGETINGVASDHYIFDERALGILGIAKSTGEMWVAAEGGYIVKYLLTTTGNADYFGEGIEGALTWYYELTNINQPVTITLPDDCPAGMVDAPLLPDATNVLNVPSLLTYDTASSLTDAADFYEEQIPALGWTLLEQPTINETTAMMGFTQEKQTMTVIITVEDTITKVQIVLVKAQQ